ncbi:MAG: ATP-binding cassette domain-containing protein [Planctomycetota bacterium]
MKGITKAQERKDQVEALLKRVNLWDVRNKKLGGYSGGMKQRFGIAQALLGNPKLIIVDEPTAGLDPMERNRFYNLLSEIGENVIVILSTHIVQDVKELCTNMAIIHEGELRFAGSPADAEAELAGKVWQKSMDKSELELTKNQYDVLSSKLIAGRPNVRIFSETDPGNGYEAITPDLEDVFFAKINLNMAPA